MGGPREGPDLGKSQVAIDFLTNSGTDPLEKQLHPSGSTVSRGRFVRPSVKYVDEFKKPDGICWILT